MKKNGYIGGIILGIGLVLALTLTLMCVKKIPAGYVGVIYNMNGGVDGEILSQGWHMVSPTKAAAIQKKVNAQQELELANIEAQTAKVQANKDKAVAQVTAETAVIQANAEAEVLRIAAEAEADANRKIAASLTPELIEKIKYEQWNGELPTVSGSGAIVSIGGTE